MVRKGGKEGRKEGSRFSVVICTIGDGSSFGRIHGIGFRAIQSWNDEFTRLQLLTLEKGRKEMDIGEVALLCRRG